MALHLGVPLSSLTHPALRKGTSALNPHHLPSTIHMCKCPTIRALSSEEIPPNALRRKCDPNWRGGFSLGVLELRGQKLELRLIEIAERQEVDEFIIGLPKSCDGKETQQSNKVCSVAGRFAVRAAERGWRVYLQDEHGTSTEAMNLMIDRGISKSARQGRIDAYAAMMVLERYFSLSGHEIELVLPKKLELQEKLRISPPTDVDFLIDEFDG
ncbi:hypothetical protein ACSBR2_004663 [Camellia fascicularis]